MLPVEVLEVWSLDHPQQNQRPHPRPLNSETQGLGEGTGNLHLAGSPGGFVLLKLKTIGLAASTVPWERSHSSQCAQRVGWLGAQTQKALKAGALVEAA